MFHTSCIYHQIARWTRSIRGLGKYGDKQKNKFFLLPGERVGIQDALESKSPLYPTMPSLRSGSTPPVFMLSEHSVQLGGRAISLTYQDFFFLPYWIPTLLFFFEFRP